MSWPKVVMIEVTRDTERTRKIVRAINFGLGQPVRALVVDKKCFVCALVPEGADVEYWLSDVIPAR